MNALARTIRFTSLALAVGLSTLAARSAPLPSSPGLQAKPAPPSRSASATERQRWLDMYARAYFPGRSGQIFLVTREGDFIVERDSLYQFMHGSVWEYDTHIPLLFYGAPFVRAGEIREPALQQDIAPTLAALIGATPPSTTTGRVLGAAVNRAAGRPRLVVLVVLDGMRADYFDKYRDLLPTLSRLRREGAWVSNASINYAPSVTSVGHATIGTGTDGRIHGQAANTLFNRVTGRRQEAYLDLDPGELMALTLADVWNLTTDGKAVIMGFGGAIRATAGLVGHGACLANGRRIFAASYSTRDAGWETNPQCYSIPDALKAFSGRTVWEAAGGRWMGHDIASPTRFRASSLFQRFEVEALVAAMNAAPLGADDVTDLVFINVKGPDYVGHAYGPDSPEIREEMKELDRQMTALVDLVEGKAGRGQSVIVMTADHGMPADPGPGRRHYTDEIAALVQRRFDPTDERVIQFYGDPANNQIFIDTARLKTLGFTLQDVARFLEAQDFIRAAFTEDEVRAAQAAWLPGARR
jgi:hypothetical protein